MAAAESAVAQRSTLEQRSSRIAGLDSFTYGSASSREVAWGAAFRVRADFVNSELERTQPAGPSPNLELNGPPRLWKARTAKTNERS